jgi:TonB family protein
MKPNIKMIDKSKNSFIYFQLGLIATMVTVLFVLNLKFETEQMDIVKVNQSTFTEETVFSYNPIKQTPKVETKQVVTNKPVKQIKVLDQFVASKNEINDNIVKESSHQETKNEAAQTDIKSESTNTNNHSAEEEEVFIVVEFLPMFPSCEGVSKEDQKACFDKAIKAAIFKNLKYPQRDLEINNEGIVYVQFIIDEKGNFTAIQSADNKRSTDEMKEAVENAVKKLPRIIPAKQGKKNVKIRYTMPITFKLNK